MRGITDYEHAEVDIETLGKKADCVVISIAIAFFDIKTGVVGDTLTLYPDAMEQILNGRVLRKDTIDWWRQQSDGAKKATFNHKSKPVETVIKSFVKFFEGHENVQVWGRGPEFDMAILEHLFASYGYETPWDFRTVQSMRTLQLLSGVEPDKKLTAHDALNDCINQAQHASACVEALGL